MKPVSSFCDASKKHDSCSVYVLPEARARINSSLRIRISSHHLHLQFLASLMTRAESGMLCMGYAHPW